MLARAARVALLVASCAAVPTLARAGVPREPRRVLILNSYHPGFQWTDGETSGVLAALGGSPRDIQVYVEYMGSKWASSPKYFRELRDAYATKYRDVRFDAIVATDDDALRFLVDYREAVFGEVPTVFCGVNDFHPAQLRGRRLYTGVNEVFDVRRSLDLALRLHPATRRIAVVSDSSISGCKIRDQFARGAREYAPRLAFEYLGERPLEEVLDRIAHLPSDSLVFHLVYFSDWRGKVIDNEETATLVSRASRVPVYGGWEFSLGHGIIGGKLLTGRDQGLLAGELARRILAGARVDQVPVVMESQSRFLFDHEQLRRFGIREADLPAGSVIVNAPPSFYALNKALVWGVLGGLGVLSIVVVLLQASRSRLQRMDEALRESQEWLKLTVEATGVGTLHTVPYGGPAVVSPRFREMHGLVDDAALQDFEAFLSIVHPDDRAGLREAVARSTDPAGDGLSDFEYRCVRPEGTARRIAARAKTQFSEENGVRVGVRFAAVTLDVTDRKREEEALRESEARHANLVATVPGVLYEFARYPDGTGRFTYLSARCSEILEVDGRDFLTDLDRIVHPDDRRALREASLAASASRSPLSEEVRITTPSGRSRWVQFTSLSCSTPSEEVDRRSGLIVDITERKRMEEALRESEEWLKLTVEATGAGIVNTVPFEPPTLSPRCRAIFGLPDDFVIDGFEGFLRLIHPADRDRARELTLAALDPASDGRFAHEARILRPDGSVRWISMTGKVQFAKVEGAVRPVRIAGIHLDVTDRKREEEALRESEERFHTLAENIPQHAFMLDSGGQVFWINRHARDYAGNEGMGSGYLALIHPDHRGRVGEKVKRCLETGATFEEIFPFRGTEGQYRWFLCRVVPLRDDAGNVVRWFGTNTDVTELREVEEALRESEARARAILASLAEGVVLHDADGKVTTANQAAERLLGVSREEMTGHTMFDGPPPGSMLRLDGSPLPPREHPVTLALQTGSGQGDVEFGMRRPDGTLVWLSNHAQPVRLPDGRVAGVVSSIFDVTQRRQALQRSEGHLRSTADIVPEGIVRFDRQLRILFANQAVADGFGLHADRLVGKTREELGRTSEGAADFDQHLLEAFRTGAPDEFEHVYEPGARQCEVRLVPERGPHGEIESVLAIVRDITDRKQAQQQLLTSREQLRSLVARLNSVREEEKARLSRELHDEMGQLLTALRLELEVLEDRLADLAMPDEVRDLLDRAVAASELVAKTVQSMRSILSSLRPLALDRLGLDATLRQECRRFEEWAGVPCDFTAADGVSSFGTEADTALFRIAQEALTNVARHAGASRVAVRLGWTMRAALLQVEDDGRGIPAGHEPTGLGLLGMRERAERLGGDLAVKPGPRGGTTVEARIPSGAPTGRKDVS
jgi:PAS domain S-box-containing protein